MIFEIWYVYKICILIYFLVVISHNYIRQLIFHHISIFFEA